MARTNQDIDEIEGSPVENKHQRLNLYLSPIEISNEMSEAFQLLEMRHGLNTNREDSCY